MPQIIGLQGREFIPRSSFRSADGKLFFGGVNGFNLFHPDSLVFNPLHENVTLTSLKIQSEEISPNKKYDDRQILAQSITETDEIVLSYKDYSFTITFSPLTFNWQKVCTTPTSWKTSIKNGSSLHPTDDSCTIRTLLPAIMC